MTRSDNYKWFIIALSGLTNAMVVALPTMGLSVLLPEISKDLNLNLVQAGLVWGIAALPMIFASLLAGTLNDRFGPRRVLVVTCILIGITGALRALSSNFALLMITVLVSSFFGPLISLSNIKNAVIWFPPRQRGLSNGLVTLGMAAGFFAGSLISATYLSPALNGWRNVFLVYGAVAVLFAVPWVLARRSPLIHSPEGPEVHHTSFRKSISQLSRLKELWLLGLAVMGVCGAVQGLLGFLPLHLQDQGWTVSSIGGVVASLHISSMIFVLPLTFLSDLAGWRSKILLAASCVTALCIGILSFVQGPLIWVLAIVLGTVRDSFMGILFTSTNEAQGVNPANSGMAIGFIMVFIGLGNLLAPPLGNSLATQAFPGAPLLFWSAMAAMGGVCVYFTRRHQSLQVRTDPVRLEEEI